MPINVSISKEDLLRSKIVKPGVYVLLVKDITQRVGKSDPDTQTTVFRFVIEDGPDKSGIGVPIDYYVGEKSWGFQRDFLEKLFGKPIPDEGIGNLDLEPTKGRKIKGYIKTEKYNGRDTNKIDGFLPMTS